MRIRKNTGIVLLFFLVNTMLILCSVIGDQYDGISSHMEDSQKPPPVSSVESYFEQALFYIWDNSKPVLKLKTYEFVSNNVTDRVHFLNPSGTVFSSEEDIAYSGKKGIFNPKEKILHLFENVKIEATDFVFESDKIDYFLNTDRLEAFGKVKTRSFFPKTLDKITVFSESLLGFPRQRIATYYGNAHGFVEKNKAYEQGISFRSKTLKLNINKGKVDLDQDVSIKHQSLTASSDRGEIFLENFNKSFKYFVLYNNVKLVEFITVGIGKEKKSFERRAFSEKLESIMSENKVLLTGNPKVFQQNDIVRGNIITLRENSETIEVEHANTNFQLNR